MSGKTVVEVVGDDTFSVIQQIQKALRKDRKMIESKEFAEKAFKAKSYDEIITLAELYCEIKKGGKQND